MPKYTMPKASLRNENAYFALRIRSSMERFREHERRCGRMTLPESIKSKHSH